VAVGPVVVYAGFWRRYAAMLIDGIIATPIILILLLPFGLMGFLTSGMADAVKRAAENGEFPTFPAGFWMSIIAITLLSAVGNWLYHTLMECSGFQGTFGKKVLGLAVTNMAGQRISFARANGRYFGKILSGMIANIGFIMAAFTEKKQALHDILSDCLVVRR
jgi:uncharacterized RDD family membrane protein YckC